MQPKASQFFSHISNRKEIASHVWSANLTFGNHPKLILEDFLDVSQKITCHDQSRFFWEVKRLAVWCMKWNWHDLAVTTFFCLLFWMHVIPCLSQVVVPYGLVGFLCVFLSESPVDAWSTFVSKKGSNGLAWKPWKTHPGWWFQFFYFHPDPWGFMIQFDLRIFFKWVGKKPPTSLKEILRCPGFIWIIIRWWWWWCFTHPATW